MLNYISIFFYDFILVRLPTLFLLCVLYCVPIGSIEVSGLYDVLRNPQYLFKLLGVAF